MNQPAARPRHRLHPLLLTLLPLAALIGSGPKAAMAAPPTNDNFVSAAAIDPAALPFTGSTDITESTIENGEPFPCAFSYQSIWYRITPNHDTWLGIIGVGTFSNVSVYADSGPGLFNLQFVSCSSSSFNGQATFLGHAGTTY